MKTDPGNEFLIEARTGRAFVLKKGENIRVIDVEGQQVADLVAFKDKEYGEKISTGATIDANGSLKLNPGDFLFSNFYNKMLIVVLDTVGRHDLLHPACRPAMYRHQYRISVPHPNCRDNLAEALKPYGLAEVEIPGPFNIFMNTIIFPDGTVRVEEPLSQAGDFIELKAQMDLIVALAACSVQESKCNAFKCTPIKVQIHSKDRNF